MGTLLGPDLFARAETGDPEALAEVMAVVGRLIPEMQLNRQDAQKVLALVMAFHAMAPEEDPPGPEPTAPAAASAQPAPGDHGELADLEAELRRQDQVGSGAAASDLGVLLDERGDVAGALAAYRRADQRGHAIGSFNLGDLCYRLRKYNEAERAYGRADQRGHTRGAYNLGVLLQGRGEDQAAEGAYWRAIERGWVHAAVNLSGLLAKRADGERQLREADREGRPGASFVLGHLLKRRGHFREAAEAFSRAAQQGYPAG
jgi:tetratricopeptide (TPR) repeat protein